jgi:phosphomannomutase
MQDRMISSDVIKHSGISFGTSGARGLVTQFNRDACAAFAVSFVSSLKFNFNFTTIAIAIDNRPSSYFMAQACTFALKNMNIDVVYYGIVPTPALAYIAQEKGIPAIMVTGSHIPFDRNGLKFYRPDGEISKTDEANILSEKVEFDSLENHENGLTELVINSEAADVYIKRYTTLFKPAWLAGKRIGIYQHSSSGRDLYPQIFEKFGAEVILLERTDHFVPIDTEAVSEEDRVKAIKWSKEFELDVIFSTDGDGDRPLISDENGHWLCGDILGLLCAKALNIQALAIPVSCNTSIELSKKFNRVVRTKIGSPHVIAEFTSLMKEFQAVAGFEANGGFLLATDVMVNGHLLKKLPTRDAVLPAIMLLFTALQKRISNSVTSLPQRFTFSDRIQNFESQKSKEIIQQGIDSPEKTLANLGFSNTQIISVDLTDGLRITLDNNSIIHLRPSGNAPELRCYTEAKTQIEANDLCKQVLQNIQKIL